MRNTLYRLILLFATVVVALGLQSCEDTVFDKNDVAGGDEINVSFTLMPEAAIASRADNDESKASSSRIGDGSKVDMLIYAVYDSNGNLLEQYSRGVDPELKDLGFDHGPGQTIKKIESFPYTVNLTLKKGVQYTLAFWAQNKNTRAYNTADLKKVEVIYSEIKPADTSTDGNESTPGDDGDFSTTTPNNDEARDVFCRSVTVVPTGHSGFQQNVYLYRPLAQINVGTSGFDYEIVTRNAIKKYCYSKIRVNRVARYLDVLRDTVLTSTTDGDATAMPEAFAVVDFGYAPLPAYTNYKKADGTYDLPAYPSYSRWNWIYDENFKPTDDVAKETYDAEEFLRVKLDYPSGTKLIDTKDSDGFLTYANYPEHDGEMGETFKYLSMCYVLTSSTKNDPIVINNIKVWLAVDEHGTDEIEVLNINHVPAQRNWRTNIVGNLLTEEKTFEVKLDQDFAGDYDGWNPGDNWEWSGPLAKGVYYDAEADEIQIYDADGLIWFQRMVNGDLRIREATSDIWDKYVGDYYHYDLGDGLGERRFKYDGIQKPSDPVLMKRILRATHQDINSNVDKKDTRWTDADGWPRDNRFRFIGYYKDNGKTCERRAKVKLMADIDLSGIEWIPIGFEGKTFNEMGFKAYDSVSGFAFGDAVKVKSAKNSNPFIRGFWGEFDGNNHTISNITTKRFGNNIPEWYTQRDEKEFTAPDDRKFGTDYRFHDNLQWLARGLFGQIFASSKIRNLRLVNVDIKGCNGVGGIVGVAFGDSIEITNCRVDGGKLEATPLLRAYNRPKINDRTFARGAYTGGIVGVFNTTYGRVDNNTVSNLEIKGYRRLGGLIGSLELAEGADEPKANEPGSLSNPISISNNFVNNSIIIGTSFSPFNAVGARYEDDEYEDDSGNKVRDGVFIYKTGFGYVAEAYNLFAAVFIGGDARDIVDKNPGFCSGNSQSNVTFAQMDIKYNQDSDNPKKRISTIATVPLVNMPLMSSWFLDEVVLNSNYYGHASAKKIYKTSRYAPYPYSMGDDFTFKFPINLPYDVDITWASDASPNANVGMYVESVYLEGKGIGGRSVITPDNVAAEGAAVMFVTARDRKQFWDEITKSKTDYWYKQPVTIKNVVLRGSPYGYTGLLLSPNENMEAVNLENVAIYDVYQTLALDNAYISGNYWPNRKPDATGIPLNVKDSNLRGYTVPGAGWSKVTYTGTTFEAGGDTGHDERLERTCRVEAPTDFKKCYFKSPYIVNIRPAVENGMEVNFTDCYASATGKNKKIEIPEGCTRFVVSSEIDGDAVVTYYNGSTVIE